MASALGTGPHAQLRTTGPLRVSPIVFGPLGFVAIFAISELAARAGVTPGSCIAKSILGLRCPGCGVTTSIAALLCGDWRSALAANVAGPIVLAGFGAQLVNLAVAMSNPLREREAFRRTTQIDHALLVSLLAAWLWHTAIR